MLRQRNNLFGLFGLILLFGLGLGLVGRFGLFFGFVELFLLSCCYGGISMAEVVLGNDRAPLVSGGHLQLASITMEAQRIFSKLQLASNHVHAMLDFVYPDANKKLGDRCSQHEKRDTTHSISLLCSSRVRNEETLATRFVNSWSELLKGKTAA